MRVGPTAPLGRCGMVATCTNPPIYQVIPRKVRLLSGERCIDSKKKKKFQGKSS